MRVLITGASRGLGLELAKEHLCLGYEVYSLSRTPCPLKAVTSLLCDLSSPIERKERLPQMCAEISPDRVILNAASIAVDLTAHGISCEIAEHIFQTNLLANVDLLTELMKNTERKIQFAAISSLSSLRNLGIRGAAYPASKAALNQIFEGLRLYSDRGSFTTVLLGRFHEGQDFARRITKALDEKRERICLPTWKFYVFKFLQWVPDRWIAHLPIRFSWQH